MQSVNEEIDNVSNYVDLFRNYVKRKINAKSGLNTFMHIHVVEKY
jgi:hypothetical protein